MTHRNHKHSGQLVELDLVEPAHNGNLRALLYFKAQADKKVLVKHLRKDEMKDCSKN